MVTARNRLAAVAAAHRLAGHEDPTSRPLVKATLKRLAREYGQPRKQAKGLTSEVLDAVKATARIQPVRQGKRRRRETEARDAMRAAVDLALLQVLRNGLLRRLHCEGEARVATVRDMACEIEAVLRPKPKRSRSSASRRPWAYGSRCASRRPKLSIDTREFAPDQWKWRPR